MHIFYYSFVPYFDPNMLNFSCYLFQLYDNNSLNFTAEVEHISVKIWTKEKVKLCRRLYTVNSKNTCIRMYLAPNML